MKKYFEVGMVLLVVAMVFTTTGSSQPSAQSASTDEAAKPLDYEFFKTRVEPIFLKTRPGHVRCYPCHAGVASISMASKNWIPERNQFVLEKLSPENTFWTEEQSRRNFAVVSALVTPGEPLKSMFLTYPLAPDAGGSTFHHGGRQFASQNDTDWLTLAEWVRRQEASGVRLQVKEDQ